MKIGRVDFGGKSLMLRVSNRVEPTVVAFAILALVLGCSSGEEKPSPDFLREPATSGTSAPVDNPTSQQTTPTDPGEEADAGEDFLFLVGGSITPEDLPTPLLDDPAIAMPGITPADSPSSTELAPITGSWPTKSQTEIMALLERERDSQPTVAQREAMARLAEIRAPDGP